MTDFDESLLALCDPAELLPARRRVEAERMQRPLRLLGSTRLGECAWLLVIDDQRGIRYGVPAVVEDGTLRRAVPGDGVSETLIEMSLRSPGAEGVIEFETFTGTPQSGESGIQVDQSNELIRVGDAMVKWNLHPADASAPGPACSAVLEAAGFTQTPRPWSHVRMRIGVELMHVASVFDFVPDAEDGWDWAVNDVRLHARGELELAKALEPARMLGALVARMHSGLATGGSALASSQDIDEWRNLADAELNTAVALESASGHAALAALEPRCREALRGLSEVTETPLIRIHGDLHIGQILRSVTQDYFVIDFDGNPSVEIVPDRQPAARDVAGMLCSLDHVARVVIRRTDDLTDSQTRIVLDWIPLAEAAFLDSYVSTLQSLESAELFDARLLGPFRVQQECREYIYADRYLPHWRYVPEAALPALLESLMKDEA